jgi:hypothetical protein
MESDLTLQLLSTIYRYYPRGIECDGSAFENSPEWRRQLDARSNMASHKKDYTALVRLLGREVASERIADNTYETLYPSYNLRVLCRAGVKWPDMNRWNWDVHFAQKYKNVSWFEVFCSYLGPFHTIVLSEFRCEDAHVLHRYLPGERAQGRMRLYHKLRTALESKGLNYLNRAFVSKIVPDVQTETTRANDTSVFALLFSDTYASPQKWDGSWTELESGPVLQTVQGEPTLGALIKEATVREQLGRVQVI